MRRRISWRSGRWVIIGGGLASDMAHALSAEEGAVADEQVDEGGFTQARLVPPGLPRSLRTDSRWCGTRFRERLSHRPPWDVEASRVRHTGVAWNRA